MPHHHYGSMATLSMASRLMASHPAPAWNQCRHISDECVPHHALTSMATLSMATLTRSMATLSMATLSMTTLSMASLSMATRLLANRLATRSAVLVSGSSLHIYRVYSRRRSTISTTRVLVHLLYYRVVHLLRPRPTLQYVHMAPRYVCTSIALPGDYELCQVRTGALTD